jgi:hypothetical protein
VIVAYLKVLLLFAMRKREKSQIRAQNRFKPGASRPQGVTAKPIYLLLSSWTAKTEAWIKNEHNDNNNDAIS